MKRLLILALLTACSSERLPEPTLTAETPVEATQAAETATPEPTVEPSSSTTPEETATPTIAPTPTLDPSPTPDPLDLDGDGWRKDGGYFRDCNDNDARIHPGAWEICGEDTDCNGAVYTSEVDLDGDGFPGCSWRNIPTDCDETGRGIYPGAIEWANDNVDSDCDGSDL